MMTSWSLGTDKYNGQDLRETGQDLKETEKEVVKYSKILLRRHIQTHSSSFPRLSANNLTIVTNGPRHPNVSPSTSTN